jgi:tetratricopeptide (TPR) repeat protein
MMAAIISIYYKTHQSSGKIPISVLRKVFFVVFVLILLSTVYSSVLLKSEIYSQKIFVESNKKHWKKIINYADEAFSRFTTLDSFSLPYHLYKGIGYTRLKKPQKAFESFEIAHKYFPTQISILNNLGSISSMLGKHDTAIFYFKKSLEVFPHYEVSLFNLSKAYYLNGDYNKAYIALLNCNTNISNPKYSSFEKELMKKINKSIK